MKSYLFVYGTLLPDYAPQGLGADVARLKHVSSGSMHGRIYDLGDYPGAVLDPAARSCISGQVFEVPDDELLQKLDAYEDYVPAHAESSLFVRLKRPIALPDESLLPCWVYIYNRDLGMACPIPGGDYSAWIACKSFTQTLP